MTPITMKQLILLIAVIAMSIPRMIAQSVPIDQVDWSSQSPGATNGQSDNGEFWVASGFDQDGSGTFGVSNGSFVFEDTEGSSQCPCIAADPNPSCGNNDNVLFVGPFFITGHCEATVSFDITLRGSLNCGSLNLQDVGDLVMDGGCPSDNGAEWSGTDALEVKFTDAISGEERITKICGSISESGTLSFSEVFDIGEEGTALAVSFSGGTQSAGASYDIGNISIVGIPRLNNTLNTQIITSNENNVVCEGIETIIVQTAADPTSQFTWAFPDGSTISGNLSNGRDKLTLESIVPAMSGTYRVTVVDDNLCELYDDIDITILSKTDPLCLARVSFSNLFSIQCSDAVLPTEDDNGITGSWTPGEVLEPFAGQTLNFRFTPDDPGVSPEEFLLTIEDLSQFPNFATEALEIPILCNAADTTYDFIEMFNLNYNDFRLVVSGDLDLFDFIPTNTIGVVNSFVDEFRNIDVRGVSPRTVGFQIDANADCGADPITKSFFVTIISDTEPIRIDTSICPGDYVEFGNHKIFQDTVIAGDNACDTMLVAKITKLKPKTTIRFAAISAACGEAIYYYDTIVGSRHIGFTKSPLVNPPPFGPNYDTIFTETFLGTYTLPFPAANGCDSIQKVSFSIGRSSVEVIEFDLCANRDTTISVGSSIYTFNKDTPYRHLPKSGCDFVEITANILPAISDTLPPASYCASDVVSVEVAPGSFMNFDKTFTYPYVVELDHGSNGCPATYVVDLTFIEPTRGEYERRICPGESFTIGSVTFDQATSNQEVLLSGAASTGCDSIVNVNVTVVEPSNIPVNEIICAEDVYVLEGSNFDINNPSGSVSIPSSLGCDSLVYNVQLSFYTVNDTTIAPKLCPGDEIFLADYNYTIDVDNLTADLVGTTSNGCAQNVLIRASIDDPVVTEFDVIICNGDVYSFAGIERTASGSYEEMLIASSGCDSISTLNLTVLDLIPVTDEGTITECQGVAVEHLGNSYDQPGVYQETLQSDMGCDSIVQFEVIFNPIPKEDIGILEMCQDQTLFFLGNEYNTEGIYEDTLQGSRGCDSIIVFEVIFHEITTTDIGTLTTCPDTPIDFLGQTYDTEGNFSRTLQSKNDCDSIITFSVSFFEIQNTDIGILNTCPDTPFEFQGQTYNSEGNHTATIQSSDGCDSILSFELLYYEIPTTDIGILTSCPRVPVTYLGNAYDIEGTYTEILQSAQGCDSLITFEVAFEPLEVVEQTVVICPGDQHFVFNNAYALEVDTIITLPGGSSMGCDTSVHLELSYYSALESDQTITICEGDVLTFGDRTFDAAVENEPVVFISKELCDSTVSLTVEVLPSYNIELGEIQICGNAGYTLGDTTLFADGLHNLSYISSLGCDSIITLELTQVEEFTENISARICAGESLEINGKMYDTSGRYFDSLRTNQGCDSLLIIDIELLEPIDTTWLPVSSICFGTTYDFEGTLYDVAGPYIINKTTEDGCDSIVVMNLEIIQEISSVVQSMTCSNEPYLFEGETFTTSGVYPFVYQAESGCDSTIILELEVLPSFESDMGIRQICIGSSLEIGGYILDQEEEYILPLVTKDGCDSLITITIDIVEEIQVDLGTIILCEGDSYNFAGQVISQSGVYSDIEQSTIGCDSTTIVNIEVTPPLVISINEIIGSCEGGANGSFVIESIPGATPPFSVSGLDDLMEITSLPFTVNGLAEGNYSFDIIDANGCMTFGEVTITNERDNALVITAVEIDPRGQYELLIDYNGEIESIEWENIDGLTCYDCPNPSVDIEETTTFRVTVIDVDGCISMAEITLEVDAIGNVYFPNIISPNSAYGNHRFYPQAEAASQNAKYDLLIFDRWGNMVYEMKDAQVNNISDGWNGRYKDNRINAGIFVYTVNIYKENGINQSFKGELTVIE